MNNIFLSSFGNIMSYCLYVLIAVLVLMLMITVHELGHYIAGKIFGFGIQEFSIGFGPKLFQKTKKDGELFSLRLLPLGGYCSFLGEDKDDDNPLAFNNKKPWQRIIVLISGAFMNYVLALIIICIMFTGYGFSSVMAYDVDSASDTTLMSRDAILSVEGKNVYIVTDLISATKNKNQGDELDFEIVRNGQIQNIKVSLKCDTDYENLEDMHTLSLALGVKENGFAITGIKTGFFRTVGRTFDYSVKLAGTVFTVLGQLLSGALGISSMGGTITTVSVTANAVRNGGLWSLLNIAGFIGVNLAVFNLLPIPALDGSRVLFTFIEWVRGRPISRNIEGIIHTVGFILILLFAVFIDLQQCF